MEAVDPYPHPIMKWTEKFYASVFKEHGDFKLQENGEPYRGFMFPWIDDPLQVLMAKPPDSCPIVSYSIVTVPWR